MADVAAPAGRRGAGLPVLLGPSRARRLQRPREPASRASGRVGLGAQRRPEARRHRLRQREEGLVEMRAWARMADIRLQQDRRRRPRLPLLRRPQGAERLQRSEDDASQDREGVEQGAQRRPEADRRDRQLQQARLVEVQRATSGPAS